MSKISDIHQAYLDHLEDVLPAGYSRLSNAYKPDDNPSILQKQGYGVQIGSAENASQSIQPKFRQRRNMLVVLTREYNAREDDVDAKATTEKLLIEDAALIQIDLVENYTLDGTVLISRWVGDSGIQYVSQTTDRFLKIEIQLQVEYFEEAP